MLKYVSLMVQAYCNKTGKSEGAALKDLAIDGFVGPDDLDLAGSKSLLSAVPAKMNEVFGMTDKVSK